MALEIASRACFLHGEVLIPSLTFVATAHSLQWQGIRPVFVDVDPQTWLIDPARIEEQITPNTTGIIGVHLWGRPCDIEALEEVAQRNRLKLLFDAAHAFGVSHRGRPIGGFGSAEVFSFHATKVINTFEGGAVATNDDEIAERVKLMQNFGFSGRDNVVYLGTNGKMSEISAAMGLSALDQLDGFIETNRKNYSTYKECLDSVPGVRIVPYDEQERNNYQYVVIEIDSTITRIQRDRLLEILEAENVIARRYFFPGCHRMEPYKSYQPHVHFLVPNTERILERVLTLPNGLQLGLDGAKRISELIQFVIANALQIQSACSFPKTEIPPEVPSPEQIVEIEILTQHPRISVEMGCFNFEKYVGEAIESILEQTLQPFEFLVSDDCSKDRSWEIIDGYAKRYPRLIRAYRHEQNIGMLKNGIFRKDKVRGDLLSPIDGDDRWLPRKLELEWAALKRNPQAKIAYSNVYTIDVNGERNGIWYDGSGSEPPSGDVFKEVFAKRFFNKNRNAFRNQLIYFSCMQEVGYRETNPDLIHTDWDRKIRWTAKYPVAYSGFPLVEYRLHAGGINGLKYNGLFRSTRYVINKNIHLLDRLSPEESEWVKSQHRTLLLSLRDSEERRVRDQSDTEVSVTPIVVNGLPGTGLELVTQLLSAIPGYTPTTLHFGEGMGADARRDGVVSSYRAPMGIDMPKMVPVSFLEKCLERMEPGDVATGHIPYSADVEALLLQFGVRMLILSKDPGEIVCAHARLLANLRKHPLHRLYSSLAVDERIKKSIVGVDQPGEELLSFEKRLKLLEPWQNRFIAITVQFRNLAGGSSPCAVEAQSREICDVVRFLGIKVDDKTIGRIQQQLLEHRRSSKVEFDSENGYVMNAVHRALLEGMSC